MGKLKKGYCFINGTSDQYFELFKIDGFKQTGMSTWEEADKCESNYDGVIYDEKLNRLAYLDIKQNKSELIKVEFENFKQLCINTFNNTHQHG